MAISTFPGILIKAFWNRIGRNGQIHHMNAFLIFVDVHVLIFKIDLTGLNERFISAYLKGGTKLIIGKVWNIGGISLEFCILTGCKCQCKYCRRSRFIVYAF